MTRKLLKIAVSGCLLLLIARQGIAETHPLAEPITFGHGQIVDAPFTLNYGRWSRIGEDIGAIIYTYSGTVTIDVTYTTLTYNLTIETVELAPEVVRVDDPAILKRFLEWSGMERLSGRTLSIVRNRGRGAAETYLIDGKPVRDLERHTVAPFAIAMNETMAGMTARQGEVPRAESRDSGARFQTAPPGMTVLGQTSLHGRSVVLIQTRDRTDSTGNEGEGRSLLYVDEMSGFPILFESSKLRHRSTGRESRASISFEIRPD